MKMIEEVVHQKMTQKEIVAQWAAKVKLNDKEMDFQWLLGQYGPWNEWSDGSWIGAVGEFSLVVAPIMSGIRSAVMVSADVSYPRQLTRYRLVDAKALPDKLFEQHLLLGDSYDAGIDGRYCGTVASDDGSRICCIEKHGATWR